MKNVFFTLILVLLGNTALFAQEFPEMVFVSGGTYTMGNPKEPQTDKEFLNRTVTVDGFFMATKEVTVKEWRYFIAAEDFDYPRGKPRWGWNEDYPIAGISYLDALAYCEWFSKKMGVKYRLATEEEWEWAARGGKKSKGYKYGGSNNVNKVAWYKNNSNNGAHAVATKEPNELGLYDMCGNVAEFCNGYMYHYKDSDPIPSYWGRVVRGGSYENESSTISIFDRQFANRVNRNTDSDRMHYDVGFRLVRD